MYKRPKMLNRQTDVNVGIDKPRRYHFARFITNVPIIYEEMLTVAMKYPILFMKYETILPVAFFGFGDQNVFIGDDGIWTAGYIPFYIERYPFCMFEDENKQMVLGIDQDACRPLSADTERLIDGSGKLTPIAEAGFEFVRRYYVGMPHIQEMMAEICNAGVFAERPFRIKHGVTNYTLHGTVVVDEKRLMALPDAVLARWARNGVLQVLHAHVQSLIHSITIAAASERPRGTLN